MLAVWLRDNCPGPLCGDPVSSQRLLHITDLPAADLGGEPPRGSWPRYLAEAGYRRTCQSAILREGLLLLSDVPTEPGTVLAVAASLGYSRETNCGRLDPAAYAAFAELLSAAPSMLIVRLRPGDCAVFDNTRVLHARTGFAQAGRRHLQGCYADLDGVGSAVAVGERVTTGVIRRKDRT